MQEPLEIRVLGPFEVLTGGTAADVGGSKRQALLAMLALRQGRVTGVDGLVDALWGEELPAAPRNAFHHHIARLRAALGEESIAGSPDGYALKGARVDAVRFEELLAETRSALRDGDVPAAADTVASALALWRGPALQGLTGTAWFSAEARRLETLRVDALEEDFEVRLGLGEHRELAPALRAALADNPFRERLWAQLMLALYRSGRQADALETFQEARRVLADELGLEPGPELRRLQEAILAPRRRGSSYAGRNGCAGNAASSWKTTISGLRWRTLATRPTPPWRFGSARWGGTSRWPTVSPRDGASSSSRSLPRTMTLRSSCGSSSSLTSATSQPKSSTSTRRSRPENAPSRLPRPRHHGSAASRN
jgi:DNA-binding SARP family transcriptional activator